jgi:plasmid maintenance system antidote protein VapI
MVRTDQKGALAAYVRTRLRREEAESPRGYQTRIATEAGLSTAHVANLINRPDQGIGMEAAAKLAAVWGMTPGELLDAATAAAQKEAAIAASATPNLDAAVEFLRHRGEVTSDAVDKARAMAAASSRDFSLGTWVTILVELRSIAHQAAEQAPTSVRRR